MKQRYRKHIAKLNGGTASIEAPESDYLYIETSQLQSAGKGLFTAVDIYREEIIAVFKGEVLTERQVQIRVNKDTDKYFIQLHDGSIMDSMKTKCFAKYANDANGFIKSEFKNNAKIMMDDDLKEVCLVAMYNIKAGQEIFCSYGKVYWNKHGFEHSEQSLLN